MKKLVLIIALMFIAFVSRGHTINRVDVQGTIQMPEGEDPQGISIFNISSNRGTVSNVAGEFNIAVALNDSISVSSLQFQPFSIVIDQGIIDERLINIRLNEVVNMLPEVVVRPSGLTGNLTVDVARLPVASLPDTLNSVQVQSMYFEADGGPDFQSPPENAALAVSQNRLINGFNFVNLFRNYLIASKIEQVQRPERSIDLDVRAIYTDDFFQEYFNIELENINDFILYADANGLDEEMLREGNEMDLIEFLLDQSKRYKKQLSQR